MIEVCTHLYTNAALKCKHLKSIKKNVDNDSVTSFAFLRYLNCSRHSSKYLALTHLAFIMSLNSLRMVANWKCWEITVSW